MALKTLLKGARCSSFAFQAGSLWNSDLHDQVICHDIFCYYWLAHGVMGPQIEICACFSFVIFDQLDQHQPFSPVD